MHKWQKWIPGIVYLGVRCVSTNFWSIEYCDHYKTFGTNWCCQHKYCKIIGKAKKKPPKFSIAITQNSVYKYKK